ncbi:MAG: hypothetical protein Q9227_001054 [Pyrenula ochraceoflavens]
MTSVSGLSARPIIPDRAFNWTFLVELIVCGILVVFFLFYFNRLFATLLSYGIRAYTWRRYKVFVDIKALQISLLGGRIFFRGIRYHGKNETILIQGGYLTWKYWLRSVRQIDYKRRRDVNSTTKEANAESSDGNSDATSPRNSSNAEQGGFAATKDLPCRIAIFAQGVEWIVYNRSPAYDAILHSATLGSDKRGEDDVQARGAYGASTSTEEPLQKTERRGSKLTKTRKEAPSHNSHSSSPQFQRQSQKLETYNEKKEALEHQSDVLSGVPAVSSSPSFGEQHYGAQQSQLPLALSLLPISIDCQKGAIVLGNENTRVILTTVFDRARGTIDAGAAGVQDLYKQIFDFDIIHPVVQMRPNPDFKQSQGSKAEQLGATERDEPRRRRFFFSHQSRRRWTKRLVHSLRDLVPKFRSSVESFTPLPYDDRSSVPFNNSEGLRSDMPWLGLDRYLDEEDRDDHAGWTSVEYARFSSIVDCPSINFTFYWDVPGLVLPRSTYEDDEDSLPKLLATDINGSVPPAYGLDITVRGGTINYGPWADRARTEIQNIFFPNPYADSDPAKPLKVGMPRQNTVFDIRIDITSETTLRIPTREESKDWQWKGKAGAIQSASKKRQQDQKRHSRFRRADKTNVGPEIRPFGWFALSVAPESCVRYKMDMISRDVGYNNLLDFELKGSKMTTSVNHDLLWRSGCLSGLCDLSNPHEWNGLHQWEFDITCNAFEMFILRDHMFLLTDLIGDWGSSSSPEYWTFVPFRYKIRLLFNDLKLYLNANDSNIINNPSELEENTFLVIHGQCLDSTVEIPLEKYRPSQNGVIFRAKLEDAALKLIAPLWNTHYTFVSDVPVATLNCLHLDGSFNYNAATSPSLTDTLILNLMGESPKFFLHGFLIRHFIKIKDNYFGEDLHFRTLEEFQHMMSEKPQTKDKIETHPSKKDNDLDVLLTVRASKGCVLLPSNLYSRKDNVKIDILQVDSEMRFNNYYSDISTRFSPLEASLESIAAEEAGAHGSVSNVQMFVNGLSIYGHRLFGAGPTEPTYVCNWDFEVGDILGECSTAFLRTLIFGIRAFAFSLDDDENALAGVAAAAIHDITFLSLDVSRVRIWLVTDDAAILLSTGNVWLSFHDWADVFSGRLDAVIPDIELAAVDRKAAARHRGADRASVKTFAYFKTALETQMRRKGANFPSHRALQLNHVEFHDRRSQRVHWLLEKSGMHARGPKTGPIKLSPPNMPLPTVSAPLLSDQRKFGSGSSSRNEKSRIRTFLDLKTQTDQLSNPSIPFKNTMTTGSNVHAHQSSRPIASGVTFSSPWLPPHFILESVIPDSSDLPPSPSQAKTGQSAFRHDAGDNEIIDLREDSTSDYTGIICRLRPDLRGYFKPELFGIVSRVLQDLQATHPADVLDELQINTMSGITKAHQADARPGNVLDFSFIAPHVQVKLLNSFDSSKAVDDIQERDQYNLAIKDARINARQRVLSKHNVSDHQLQTPPFVMHLLSQELTLQVSEDSSGRNVNKAAARASVQGIEFWLSTGKRLSSNLQIQSIDCISWGTRVEYLAELIHRTSQMSASTAAQFEDVRSQETKRLRYLVYALTDSGMSLPDPVFLTRPSYVLRGAGDHLRSNDSWKIISRLRFIYRNLPKAVQQRIIEQCFHENLAFPTHAKDHVLKLFDQWRTWDLSNIRRSDVMRFVWGSTSTESTVDDTEARNLLFMFLVGQTKLLLDPGPRQSEFIFARMNGRIQSDSALAKNGLPQEIITVQVYCSETALRLNWELCELVDDTIALFQQVPDPEDTTSNEISTSQNQMRQCRRETHVVLGTDIAGITLDSVNLTIRMATKNFKASFVHLLSRTSLRSDMGLNALLSSTSASAEVRSQTKTLMIWRLSQPNLYAAFNEHISKNSLKEVHVAGTCQRLLFDMPEDFLAILEVADQVICDEVNYLDNLAVRMMSQSPERTARPDTQEAPKSSPTRVTAALFLDSYSLSIAMLPSLVYHITGQVARTGVRPQHIGSTSVHIDIEKHQHTIKSKSSSNFDFGASFDLPAINGGVLVEHAQQPLFLNIDAAIEKVVLEGTSVRALIDAINQAELKRAFKDARLSVQTIQSRIEKLPSMNRESTEQVHSPKTGDLKYDAKFSLAGFSVHTSAPGLSGGNYEAGLLFVIGPVLACVQNTGNAESLALPKPAFDILIDRISLELSRRASSEALNYGRVVLGISASGKTQQDDSGTFVQFYNASTDDVLVELYAETAYLIIDIASHLEQQMKTLELPTDVKRLQSLRRMTQAEIMRPVDPARSLESGIDEPESSALALTRLSLAIRNIRVLWIVDVMTAMSPGRTLEDLMLTIAAIDLTTQQENSARLKIEDLQMQMVPKAEDKSHRTLNSALLPEMIFNVAFISNKQERRLAFQAAGKALDLRLTSDFIVPASILRDSLVSAIKELRKARTFKTADPSKASASKDPLFGEKRLASLLIDVDFAGAVVTIQARPEPEQRSVFGVLKGPKRSKAGKYGHIFEGESASQATLKAPGVALKVEYQDSGYENPSLNAEIRVAASSNTLYPSVVPLILEISSSIKEIMGESDTKSIASEAIQSQIPITGSTLSSNSSLLGRCTVNMGVWIQGQDFSLSCQPIARVAATARFDDIVVTVNTVQSPEQDRFYAMLVSFNSLQASVRHVYSRESTASFDVERIVVSLMNSKHVSSTTGLSAILKISPVLTSVNAKQLQDFLLFREIWYPAEIRNAPSEPSVPTAESQSYIVQRYQQVAATGAFPWNAVVSIEELKVQIDLGQSLGKSQLTIANLWASSKKKSDWEQNLCVGFESMGIDSTGRMSGFVELHNLKVRTTIRWPLSDMALQQTPLIQASLGFGELRVKVAFDYQPFLVADITAFDFLMYNVRETGSEDNDRLVAILDGDKVQVFCTTAGASQGLALVQAFERLIQEKQAAYVASIKELEKYLRRTSVFPAGTSSTQPPDSAISRTDSIRLPLALQTDVVVTLKALNVGAFPSTFFDSLIFKVEASEAQARFAVSVTNGRTHSGLGLTLGQLRVALSTVDRTNTTTALGEVAVDDVVTRATGSRGGTILKVPRVRATMQTWQEATSNHIEYIFKSAFEGKVDVGWNYSRISYIRGMWTTHSKALSHRLGKPLPQSAVQITGGPPVPSSSSDSPTSAADALSSETGSTTRTSQERESEKITAVVNVPESSKFTYTPLEPPVIETPQLRDMGEATPPLEWIGLHREKLPNLTHQIIIVGLLEVCREVEEAYGNILGRS